MENIKINNKHTNKVKVLAMYLPQYHEIPENSRFWGEGFTDWVSVKKATSLYSGHNQPNVPLNENYYDLSEKENLYWQIQLAKKYGVYGFGIYHYWFSSEKQLLTRPAELILENDELDIPFFFAWDNISWKRTWSKLKGNDWSPIADDIENKKQRRDEPEILIEYKLGKEEEWKKHFDYLIPYFKDKRYIKIENKPVFVIYNYASEVLEMAEYWNNLAIKNGFDGVFIMYRYDSMLNIPSNQISFNYEPAFSGWGGTATRIVSKITKILGKTELQTYSYDKVWNNILVNAKKNTNSNRLFGAFVNYDDTPRRGKKGKVITESSPEKFGGYIRELLEICKQHNKEYIFLTAWNEWGEGAYLEPDTKDEFGYLEALKGSLISTDNWNDHGGKNV